MDIHRAGTDILHEISLHFENLNFIQLESLAKQIMKADAVFLLGAGRSKLMLSTFCLRLNHLGITSYIVGEIPCPPTTPKSLIIAASGSGKTCSIMSILNKQKQLGTNIFLITANNEDSFEEYADNILRIDVPNSLFKKLPGSNQLMRTAFEQIVFLIGESIVYELSQDIPHDTIASRHTNLE
ncbi:SIS domain-containing protein [uncultured Sphaerochaeta sp.]|uniref:SIS domain-containing protein n=1 Tax=uncultured Sphaerochaeta sp. TaxID=886478 RepID=UPI0029CA7543|nr:SIS domain-containing protein [uncultured Sphaerochaeta sp.]